jgi:hypothetical protein
MGTPLTFSPGHRVGWLEVLDSKPTRTQQEQRQKTHKLWRVWCHYCESETLVRATSLNPENPKHNLTCGCRIGGRRGSRIRVDSDSAFRNTLYCRRNRLSRQIAPFVDPNDPKQLIVTDPEHPNYKSYFQTYGSDFLIGVYDDDSTSYDVREDYISLIKSHCLTGTIDLQKGLDALESLIYKNRRRK